MTVHADLGMQGSAETPVQKKPTGHVVRLNCVGDVEPAAQKKPPPGFGDGLADGLADGVSEDAPNDNDDNEPHGQQSATDMPPGTLL